MQSLLFHIMATIIPYHGMATIIPYQVFCMATSFG